MPYLLQEALEAHNVGMPLVRSMFLEIPEDFTTYTLDTQYCLGSNHLIAPIFAESGEVRFYVPESKVEGDWVSWFDRGKRYKGGKWYTEVHDFSTLPILIRPGTVTAINTRIKDTENDFREGLELLVNGRITGEITLSMVNPKQPDTVDGVVSVSPNNGQDLAFDCHVLEKNWSVTYLGKANPNSEVETIEKEGSTKFRSNTDRLTLQVR